MTSGCSGTNVSAFRAGFRGQYHVLCLLLEMFCGSGNLFDLSALPACIEGETGMKVIDDWLDDKLAARQMVLGFVEDAGEFSMLAGALRAEAQAEGYSQAALVAACGGDICSYLMQITQRSTVSLAAE